MLLFIIPGFPKDESDSTCLPQIQQFFLALKSLSPQTQITILALQYPFEKKTYTWNGIEVVSIGGKNKLFLKPIVWLKAYNAIKSIHKTRPIKMLLSFWLGEASLLAQVFGRRHDVKRYFWLHGQDVRPGNIYVPLVRPQADQLIAISEFSSRQFFDNYQIHPFIVAENGINPAAFPELNSHDRGYSILGVGSLIPLKNYILFIELVAKIHQTFPQLKVNLIGEGPQEKELIVLRNKLGLEHVITFLGKLPYSEVLDRMNQSKVFLHTSTFEGSSSVIAEALYSGCQVVSTVELSAIKTDALKVSKEFDFLEEALIVALRNESLPRRLISRDLHDTARLIMGLARKNQIDGGS